MRKNLLKTKHDCLISDPIIIRKKINLSDSVYKKSNPGELLWDCNISLDTEMCLLVLIAAVCVAAAVCKTAHLISELRLRHQIKHLM